MKSFTEDNIDAWRAYERVRKSGRWNMFDPRARRATKLSPEEYAFVMSHYSELKLVAESLDANCNT